MDKLLKNAFKMQIQSKEGFEFEEFIDELFLLKYGVDNYMPVRRNKDKGNDGTILPEQKILACYAPRKYSKTDFETKVLGAANKEGDFEKYQKNWKDKFSNWEMYVNHEVSSEQFTLIQGLDGNTSIMVLVMAEFNTITNILSGYNDDEINTLKRRVINNYNKLSGNFKERLYNLTDQYTTTYGNIKDDEYVKCVKSILLYMFEQCLIGRKTENEL